MTRERRKARIIRNGARISDVPMLIGAGKRSGKGRARCSARLIRDDNGKERIEVRCACGETILIECEYEVPSRDEEIKH